MLCWRKVHHHTGTIMAFIVLSLNIFFSVSPSHFDFLSHICENNPRLSSACMNSDFCGPQIAAAEPFTAQFSIRTIWFQTCKIIFGPKAKPGICLQDWIHSFCNTIPRLACVISVWFQPTLLVLLPAVAQQVMGQWEGKLGDLWLNMHTQAWGSVTKMHQRASTEDRRALLLPLLWLMAGWSEEKITPPQTSSLQICWEKALGNLPAFQVSGICLWLRSVVEVFSSVNSRIGVMLNTSLCGESSHFSPSLVWQLAHTDDAAVFLHVSNRCGRRPSFWGKNWLNSTRMKCLILNSSARPWWAHLFPYFTHCYHEVKWPTKI